MKRARLTAFSYPGGLRLSQNDPLPQPGSTNLGEVDIAALIAGRPQALLNNPAGRYQLYRIGDAVASRNIHAAIYDARRLCKDL